MSRSQTLRAAHALAGRVARLQERALRRQRRADEEALADIGAAFLEAGDAAVQAFLASFPPEDAPEADALRQLWAKVPEGAKKGGGDAGSD